ncbi:MAG: peptidoglycan editing factor PgeF [Rhodothermales bacterium]|nr:peptidoglycan editing factor PgeF [Rhodothermales bacterium]
MMLSGARPSSRGTPEIRRPAVFGSKVVAGFSTRHGGLSTGAFESLNVGLNTRDIESIVLENRERLFQTIGRKWSDVAIAGQVHGTAVSHADVPGLYAETDALVTNTPDRVLAITAADCAVVLMADEEAGVVGACHAGWRGAAGRICSETIRSMVKLGARAEDICAYVSPCISVDRFEVGEEVARLFNDRHVVRSEAWTRPHVDLKSCIADELFSCGVPSESVEVSPECTCDSPDFFSYRCAAGDTGRMMGFIMISLPG